MIKSIMYYNYKIDPGALPDMFPIDNTMSTHAKTVIDEILSSLTEEQMDQLQAEISQQIHDQRLKKRNHHCLANIQKCAELKAEMDELTIEYKRVQDELNREIINIKTVIINLQKQTFAKCKTENWCQGSHSFGPTCGEYGTDYIRCIYCGLFDD